MRANMRSEVAAVAGLASVLVLGLVAFGQVSTGNYSFEAGLPLVIGDVVDPFQYDGEAVRELLGEAFVDVDPRSNLGLLRAEVRTTDASGPIVVAEGTSLEGLIRIEMERFLGSESYMSGGIAEQLFVHGDTGVMAATMPELYAELVGWGLLDIYVDEELVYDDLPAHFMVTQRVRRPESEGYTIARGSDGQIYSPELLDKSGFMYSTDRELHLWASSSIPGLPSSIDEAVFLHLNFLLRDEEAAIAGGGGTSSEEEEEEVTDKETPDKPEKPEKPDAAGPKGNNGIGNGEDDQPPGDPKINDDAESVADGNASGGKGKKN